MSANLPATVLVTEVVFNLNITTVSRLIQNYVNKKGMAFKGRDFYEDLSTKFKKLAFIADNRRFFTSEDVIDKLNGKYTGAYIRHVLNGQRKPVEEIIDAAESIIKEKAKAALAAA